MPKKRSSAGWESVYLGQADILEEPVDTVLEFCGKIELTPVVQCGPEYRTRYARLAGLNIIYGINKLRRIWNLQ